MPMEFRIILLCLGVGLLLFILELVRRGRFREELSLIWVFIGVGMSLGAFADKVVDPLAKRLGVYYPPAAVFALLIFFVVIALLYFSIVISDLKSRTKELAQELALLRATRDLGSGEPKDQGGTKETGKR